MIRDVEGLPAPAGVTGLIAGRMRLGGKLGLAWAANPRCRLNSNSSSVGLAYGFNMGFDITQCPIDGRERNTKTSNLVDERYSNTL